MPKSHLFISIQTKRLAALILSMCCLSNSHGRTLSVAIDPSSDRPNPSYIEANIDTKKRFEKIRYEKIPGPNKVELWKKLVEDLALRSRTRLRFVEFDSQLDFEIQAASGDFDFVYLSPASFVSARKQNIYRALAKPKSKPMRGIMVIPTNSTIESVRDLSGQPVGFPGVLNFGASIAPRDSLYKLGIEVDTVFLDSADSAYMSVLDGSTKAALGTRHTFDALSPTHKDKLKVIWDTPGYTPYAFVAHSSVPFFAATKFQKALVSLFKSKENREMLEHLNIDNGFEVAKDSDWNDIEAMDLKRLMHGSKISTGH